MPAELVEDGGEAARDEAFFRSAEFLAAEDVTHTLVLDQGDSRAAIPVIVRPIADTGLLDATSPYAYPGARVDGQPINPSDVDWGGAGIVSLFIRDRVHGAPCFESPTERSVVLVSDPATKRKSRMSDRQQIRRNEAAGYAVRSAPGPEAAGDDVTALHQVYTETMRAVDAAERYMFGRDYFAGLLGSPLSEVFVVDGPAGEVAAAAIVVKSDGALHYYLSGTSVAHRSASPSKNLIVAVTERAEQAGLPMNLGGGLAPGDSLEQFKRGFANMELPYRTHEIVCDRAAYEELAAGQAGAGAGFFPAYRAG